MGSFIFRENYILLYETINCIRKEQIMKIEKIEVTNKNLMDIIRDDSMFIIKKDKHWNEGYKMKPVKEGEISDLLSEDCAIIQITEE